MKESEADFQGWVIDTARRSGWLVHHTRPAMNRRGHYATPIQGDKGFPDLVLARQGRVIFAELKTTKARPSSEQKAWLHHLMPVLSDMYVRLKIYKTVLNFRCFTEVYLWRPQDREEIMGILGLKVS